MVSIIVPVFNAEKYLNECVVSVIAQINGDWELIFVNDGSTDSSLAICNKFLQNDSRFRLINQTNQGVSAARNNALDVVRGEWVTFLDSDDRLFSYALNLIEECDDDVGAVFGNSMKVLSDGNYTKDNLKIDSKELIHSILNFPDFIKNHNYIKAINNNNNWSCWGKFFRTQIINDNKIRFNTHLKLGEDLLFCLEYYRNIDKVCLNNSHIYFYRENNFSATHRFRTDRITNTKTLLAQVFDCIKSDEAFFKDYYHFVVDRLITCIKLYYNSPECPFTLGQKNEDLRELCSDKLIAKAIRGCSYKNLSSGKKTNLIYKMILFCLKHNILNVALCIAKI